MATEQTDKVILVTGGAGFIGSHFIDYYTQAHPTDKVINYDNLTYAANMDFLKQMENQPNYQFVKGDIADFSQVQEVFNRFQITDVIHFAAESHVDRSIHDPSLFIRTNINGTYHLLEAARNHWKKMLVENRFHHISTDEVYGSLKIDDAAFTEESPYSPNSPYSASKASSDMLVRSYHHTYGLNTVITNCSNNYGSRQHQEKFIPTVIQKALALEKIPIYGEGKNIRDWLYVKDHCEAIELIFSQGKAGSTYNIGGNNEWSNIDLATEICNLLDQLVPDVKANGNLSHFKELMTFVKDRPGHDLRYAIDSSKLSKELGWNARTSMMEGLKTTVEEYINEAK